MPSPEPSTDILLTHGRPANPMRGPAPFSALVAKELRDLASGRAFWVMLVLLSLLVGASFDQAVALYSEASRAAAQTPLLARGLSPLDGILVPTFGALYLAATFLLPFVVIRMVGAEKESGALKLMLQLPYSPASVMAAKLVASFAAWITMALVPLSAVAAWLLMGGHIAPAETANLLLGHLVYALAIAGIAMLCAAVTDNTASKAKEKLRLMVRTATFLSCNRPAPRTFRPGSRPS